ncbi:MAG: DUF2868 domain-containing protein [Burkholderiales bacterium]|nr:DUF2868 domain-containing protein [Burkholderiales bacterium]
MNESDARSALLVRAYETAPPALTGGHWTGDDRDWATQAALRLEGEHASAAAFIARRARLAAERLCSRDAGARLVAGALAWRPWIGWALALAAFAIGLATDAIGPARQINILAPPLLAVIAWNLLVYAALAARAATRLAGSAARDLDPLARQFARVAHAAVSAARISRLTPVLAGFARDWTVASAPLSASRVARMLHTAAASLAAGALFGMYLRGFALEYRAVWESTFLDASAVHAILAVVLGPAAAINGVVLPDAAALAAIRSSVSPGENAARWIHLYATTLALIVLLPRTLLALGEFFAGRRLANRFPLYLDEGYFQAIARAQRGVAARVRILPYSYRPSARAMLGLNALAQYAFGPGSLVDVAPTVAFGGEDALDPALFPVTPPALAAALFPLTATPERENHGAFVEAAAARLPQPTPFVVLVDESAFRQRFDDSGASGAARRMERRAAWQRLLAATGRAAVFVDLEAEDFAETAGVLRAAIEQAAARAAQADEPAANGNSQEQLQGGMRGGIPAIRDER